MKEKVDKSVDFCVPPLLPKLIKFAIPLILSGLLQLLYNATDIIVVGRFAGETAMAAVGSTGALVNLITNLFIGLSVGALATTAKWVGAKDLQKADRTVHTAVAVSLIGGFVTGIVGFFLSKTFLQLMDSPENVLDQSAQYLKIFFIGMPVNLLYNFGGSVLRACGDAKRPLIFLLVSGAVNVALDLIAVGALKMGVKGAAIATVSAQLVSAALVTVSLTRRKGYGKLSIKRIRINKTALKEIMSIGLPAGIQSTIFSLSNVIIQSSINSFGELAMAGNAASANIEGFIYVSMNSVAQSCLTFTGQNYGAAKPKNMTKTFFMSVAIVTVVGLVLGFAARLAGGALLGIYNSNPEVIAYGLQRITLIGSTYFLCGIMETLVGSLRGMGHSVTPMVVSILGVCGVRIVWIYTLFAKYRTLFMLYLSYPVSWLFTALIHFICLMIVRKKVYRRIEKEKLYHEQEHSIEI